MTGITGPTGGTEVLICATIGAGVVAMAKIARGYYNHSAVEDWLIRIIPGMHGGPGPEATKLFIAELLISSGFGALTGTFAAAQVAESILRN
mgnify:CR=1 FL=1